MNAFVVDTNVPIVANGRSEQASPSCVLACVESLEAIKNYGTVVLDDGMRILHEYMNNLSLSGQPGVGDAFMKWVWSIQAVNDLCEQVPLHERPEDDQDFEEFPRDPALIGFDRNDRKFVAVALASRQTPIIINAVDPDWWTHREVLRKHGIRIRFLCPDSTGNES